MLSPYQSSYFNYAGGYQPVNQIKQEEPSTQLTSPKKNMYSESFALLDLAKQFDSLHDINNYEEYKERMLNSLSNSQLYTTQASQSIQIRELETRCYEYKRLLKFTEDELSRSKISLIDMREHFEELLKEKTKRVLELEIKEEQYFQSVLLGRDQSSATADKPRISPQASQRQLQKESLTVNVQKQKGDSQQKPESESEINSLGEDVKSQKFDKFYKYDMQLKKFEISAAQKDLEIASLAKELEKLSSQIRMREQQELKDREKRKEFQNSLSNLPIMEENVELKRMNGILKAQNSKLKRQLEATQNELNTIQADNSSLNYQIGQYMTLEKTQWADTKNRNIVEIKTQVNAVSNDQSLLKGLTGLLDYLRSALTEILLELFIRSNNTAYQRKTSSLTIFQINQKQLFDHQSRGLIIPLYLYKKMKQLVRIYYPNYAELDVNEAEGPLAQGQEPKPKERNQVNEWVLSSLASIEFKASKSKNPQKEGNDLFRLLAVFYRTRYPITGIQVSIDEDIDLKLQDTIVETMLKLSIEDNTEEDQHFA